jgi:hypothetical protein
MKAYKIVIFFKIILLGLTSAMAQDKIQPTDEFPKPIDGNIAVQQEYVAAKEADNKRERLELFIARHPDHELAVLARKELSKL